MVPQRGACYVPRRQTDESTAGLLVVSAQRANRLGEDVTAVPVRHLRGDPTDVAINAGFVAIGRVVRLHALELGGKAWDLAPAEQARADEALASLLLIGQLCSADPIRPGVPDGDYPRWGHTYCAEPPVGGQTKRWLVVSHNVYNAYSGLAVCVRTTSNTSLEGPVTPSIQRGLALAVAPDVMTKRVRRFDLSSAGALAQAEFSEMRKVAIGLGNHLELMRWSGLVG